LRRLIMYLLRSSLPGRRQTRALSAAILANDLE